MKGPVLILGAGFSRAVSSRSPLTDELGNEAIKWLPHDAQPASSFRGGYFEAWLSRLAEAQPDLSLADNQRNSSYFTIITRAIHDILSERELEILDDAPPDWLGTFLSLAHVSRATLLTFNYDTLVEHAVMSHLLFDWDRRERASWHDVVDHTPPLPPVPARLAGDGEVSTLRLLKLHGSTNTYWVPGDQTGATIHRWDLFGAWGSPQRPDPVRRRRELPGRTPFIVPPAAAKSSYYGNPITRHFWRQAGEALALAGEVVLLGYSLPPTDLVTSGMLGFHLTSRHVPVVVVNPDPAPVVERLRYLGVADDAITTIDTEACVPLFVDGATREASRQAATDIGGLLNANPLVVAWGEPAASIVTDVVRSATDPSVVELTVEAINSISHATRSRTGPTRRPVQGNVLKAALDQGASQVVAVFPSGRRCLVVGYAEWTTDVGFTNRWTVLVPAGSPESG